MLSRHSKAENGGTAVEQPQIHGCTLAQLCKVTLCRLRVDLIRAGHVSSNAMRIHFGILQAINVVRSSGLSTFLIAAMHSGVEPSLPR